MTTSMHMRRYTSVEEGVLTLQAQIEEGSMSSEIDDTALEADTRGHSIFGSFSNWGVCSRTRCCNRTVVVINTTPSQNGSGVSFHKNRVRRDGRNGEQQLASPQEISNIYFKYLTLTYKKDLSYLFSVVLTQIQEPDHSFWNNWIRDPSKCEEYITEEQEKELRSKLATAKILYDKLRAKLYQDSLVSAITSSSPARSSSDSSPRFSQDTKPIGDLIEEIEEEEEVLNSPIRERALRIDDHFDVDAQHPTSVPEVVTIHNISEAYTSDPLHVTEGWDSDSPSLVNAMVAFNPNVEADIDDEEDDAWEKHFKSFEVAESVKEKPQSAPDNEVLKIVNLREGSPIGSHQEDLSSQMSSLSTTTSSQQKRPVLHRGFEFEQVDEDIDANKIIQEREAVINSVELKVDIRGKLRQKFNLDVLKTDIMTMLRCDSTVADEIANKVKRRLIEERVSADNEVVTNVVSLQEIYDILTIVVSEERELITQNATIESDQALDLCLQDDSRILGQMDTLKKVEDLAPEDFAALMAAYDNASAEQRRSRRRPRSSNRRARSSWTNFFS